ncbi:signal peptide peptidase SppA [Halocalculus aciditolerans]|uniref:Peptidase S49 domain-containing protein n=1 Tax=Halocalculus aciditolerans TaxID=1383812 RepID=A0A830FL35_9EURY|nr:signal peptide peptidase SppA [Halocalculus aciditolerans]GGL63185.1 hypothetical protein GCM10009039_21360 [Halocalculus aciditolerans]
MDTTGKRLGRLLFAVVGALVGVAAGFVAFLVVPAGSFARLVGVALTVGLAVAAARLARGIASSWFAPYNAAEVAVEGPITRDGGGGGIPPRPGGLPADAVVEQVESADADPNVEALIVRLNTPGGEVVPSDDIRNAVADFDGPTAAYATDTCASGGYWIASGCDRIVARDASIVGSIGVIGSTVNASDLADELGISYERFAAGKFKDAGVPLKQMSDDDRDYLQGIVDDYYDSFVERVADGRDLDPAAIRDTEARVYLGEEALDLGLVDELGTRDAVDDYLAGEIGDAVETEEFAPSRGMLGRLRGGATAVAYAAGAGAASVVAGDDEFRLR